MLDGAHAPNAHPSARGAPGSQTPRKVRIHVHSEGNPFVLPREAADAPRTHDQAQNQSDQRRPVRGGGAHRSPAEFLSRKPQVRAAKTR
eukprot:13677471-Alexandrium_andersonii.AAC.1